jgi:hypothetical protein
MTSVSSAEPLWALRRDHRSVRAELRRQEGAWEVRLFSDGQWFAAHTLGSRELALVWADGIYDGLVADGWIPGSRSIHAPWGALRNM